MRKEKWIQLIGFSATLIGLGATLLSDWVNDQKINEKITEKIDEKLSVKNAKEES